MVKNDRIHDLLFGTIDSVKSVIPLTLSFEEPTIIENTMTSISMGVSIQLTGDLQAQLFIFGESDVFQKLSETMFGMQLEGEMLHSFTGELGNMIAGNLSNYVSQIGLKTDITPPSIIFQEIKTHSSLHTVCAPVKLPDHSKFSLMIEL
ncbi:chemotaxis protein CheX [Bacillus alkalisoli]|nr:chemotaxis protein CheX [Bacillus alkalisoli]